MNISFNIAGQILKRIDSNKIVADSRNYLTAHFKFTDEWNGLDKTALFNGIAVKLDNNNSCYVPDTAIYKVKTLVVSVYGGDLITTSKREIELVESGYMGEPLPDYEELYNDAKVVIKTQEEQIAQQQEQLIENQIEIDNALTKTIAILL